MARKKKKQKQPEEQIIMAEQPDANLGNMVASLNGHELDPNTVDLIKSRFPNADSSQINSYVRHVMLNNPSQSVFTDEEFNNFREHQSFHRKDAGRLEDEVLLDISQQDPDIASIISTRVSQITVFAGEPVNLYDRGIKIVDIEPLDEKDLENEEFIAEQKNREKEKDAIMRWIKTCGVTNEDVLDTAFSKTGKWNKKCSLKDYLQMQTRNLLVLGRMGRENIWGTETCVDENGEETTRRVIQLFRPMPIETIRPANMKGHNPIIRFDKTKYNDYSMEEKDEYNKLNEEARDAAYVQEIYGKIVAFFKDDKISIKHYQKQSNYRFQVYPLSPIEQAIATVYKNHCVNKHLTNKFQSGMLSKSMMVIRPSGKGGEGAPSEPLSRPQIRALQESLQKMGRIENSSLIPILAGNFEVQMINLQPENDSEWKEVRFDNKRSYLSAFQISAKELSWGQLGDTGTLGTQSHSSEYEFGEERGVRILADILTEDLDEVKNSYFPFGYKYRFEFQGIGVDSKESALEKMDSEQNTIATLNDLLSRSEQNNQIALGGDMPLNPLWHSNVVRYMTMAEVRKHFFRDEEAMNNPDLQFFVDPAIDQLRLSKKTEDLQIEAQKLQNDAMKAQIQGGQQQEQQQQQQQEPSLEESKGYQEKPLNDMVQKSIKVWKDM